MTCHKEERSVIDIAQAGGNPLSCPFFSNTIPAGFPSTADDYIEKQLDLNELIVKHPAATFYVRVAGESMRDAGIASGDILVVDRAIEAVSGKIIVAIFQGEFTVKRLRNQGGRLYLEAAHPAYPPLEITPESDFQAWGVVTHIIRPFL